MLYSIAQVVAVIKAAVATAAAWLFSPPSLATATVATISARFDVVEARLHALRRKAEASAYSIAAAKHTYALPIAPKNPRDVAKDCIGTSRVGVRVTILTPAGDVPYATARREMKRIGRRSLAIAGASEHEGEAFVLEKTLAEWERILPTLPGFVDERELAEATWVANNTIENAQALQTVRSCVPVDIARMSVDELAALPTPSGRVFPAQLAFRLKDSPILQLVREDTELIERMHPSVLRRYSTYGLTLLERRALFQVLHAPAIVWRSHFVAQSSPDLKAMLASKIDWHQQLVDELVRLTSSDRVLTCDLYDQDLGFPTEGTSATDVVMHGLR